MDVKFAILLISAILAANAQDLTTTIDENLQAALNQFVQIYERSSNSLFSYKLSQVGNF